MYTGRKMILGEEDEILGQLRNYLDTFQMADLEELLQKQDKAMVSAKVTDVRVIVYFERGGVCNFRRYY
jgi:hypothetical protein